VSLSLSVVGTPVFQVSYFMACPESAGVCLYKRKKAHTSVLPVWALRVVRSEESASHTRHFLSDSFYMYI